MNARGLRRAARLATRHVPAAFGALLLFACTATAASRDGAQLPIRFKQLTAADGLSQATVLSAFEDSTGFVWLGTENGLNRYYGYGFDVYQRDRQQPGALLDDTIWAIDEDEAGDLWLATGTAGIARWHRATGRFEHFMADAGRASSLSDDRTRTLLVREDDTLLVGSREGGVDHFTIRGGRVLANYRNFDGDPDARADDAVYALLPAGDQRYYVGTDAGLFLLDLRRGRAEAVTAPGDAQGTLRQAIRSLMRDGAGRLWIGTRRHGVVLLGAQGEWLATYEHRSAQPGSLSSNHVTALRQDRAGRIWIGTKGGLDLFRPATQSFAHYRARAEDPTSLAGNNVMSLLEDANGLLWVGTQTSGVSIFNPRSWAFGHYKPPAEAAPDARVVAAFVETGAGELWMGTFGDGLHRLTRAEQTGQVIDDERLDLPLGDDYVMALARSRHRGGVWIGLMSGGLRYVDTTTGQVTAWRHDPADPATIGSDGIMTLYEDAAGVLWVGTWQGGLSRLAPDGTLRRISQEEGLAHHSVTAIAEDLDGQLWAGTNGGGVNLMSAEGRVLATFRSDRSRAASLASDTVYDIHVDEQGAVWIGGKAGLDRVLRDPGPPDTWRFRNIARRDGLPNNTVYGIRHDKAGMLWLSTNYGLTRFDPIRQRVTAFHEEHGLQSEEFNYGAHYATADGALCFGGANGLNAFYPARLQLNRRPPPAVLTSVMVPGRPVEAPAGALQRLELTHRDDVITFEFAALDFTAPERNAYSYRLVGFDDGWVSPGAVRRATYTNLDQGHYTFEVRARNSDGFWNEAAISLPVHVLPAPWRTWWAYSLYGLCALGALIAVPYAQQRRLQREEQYRRRLENEVSERTQALAAQTEKLQALNQKLRQASFTDPLTGLANRRFLFEGIAGQIDELCRVHAATERPVPDDLLFVMIDLDHFKPVNDCHGHAAGDALLLAVTESLNQACSPDNGWIIRWGGDEFLVVRRLRRGADPLPAVERLRSCVANTLVPAGNGQFARTTTSIGFARFPFIRDVPGRVSWEQVIGIADLAMYAAKEKRNTVVGYLATESSASCPNLMARLQDDPVALIEAGYMAVCRPPENASGATGTTSARSA